MSTNLIRINKAFSVLGIMSRRATETAIKSGRIKVNGKLAQVGMQINLQKDVIELDGNLIKTKMPEEQTYIMLNKPRGYLCTAKDEQGRKIARSLMPDIQTRIYNIGRLDKNSEGLLLFTNDGEFANSIMHPKNKITKEYKVTVTPKVNKEILVGLNSQLSIDGQNLAPATVKIAKEYKDRTILNFVITQGKNRQIRKMCQTFSLEVKKLKRVRIGQLKLGTLAAGKYRHLTEQEVMSFKKGGWQ